MIAVSAGSEDRPGPQKSVSNAGARDPGHRVCAVYLIGTPRDPAGGADRGDVRDHGADRVGGAVSNARMKYSCASWTSSTARAGSMRHDARLSGSWVGIG